MAKPSPRKKAAKKPAAKKAPARKPAVKKSPAQRAVEVAPVAKPVPIEDQLTEDDYAVMAMDDEPEIGSRDWATARGWLFVHEQPASWIPQPDGSMRPGDGDFRAEKAFGGRLVKQGGANLDSLLRAIASWEDDESRRNPSAPPRIVEGLGTSLDNIRA